jgi:uncharacterized protein (DUF983 family)
MFLPILLIMVVAVGIAWPFLKQRGLIPEKVLNLLPSRPAAPVADSVGAEGVPAVPVRRGSSTESLCPYCSRLNPAFTTHCVECGGQMPVDKLSSLWEGADKQQLKFEAFQCGGLLLLMVLAMLLSYNLDTWGKIVLLLVTVGALAFRLMKVIQG